MKIEKSLIMKVSAEKAWEVVGHEFTQVDTWASDVFRSSGALHGEGSERGGERVCATSLGDFTETITRYDEKQMKLSYTAKGEKMPFFVKRLENNWHLHPTGEATRVEMRMEAKLRFPFNILVGPFMQMQFAKVLNNALQELKHYLEADQPHPRKISAMQKAREEGLLPSGA